jgi:hypothetical protein
MIINQTTGSPIPDMMLAAELVAKGVDEGYTVALVSLCGFGEMGGAAASNAGIADVIRMNLRCDGGGCPCCCRCNNALPPDYRFTSTFGC